MASLERLLILTGDPSADMHAAHVVEAIRASGKNVDIHAVGGHYLQNTGIPLISDQSKMARVGFGSIWGAYDHWKLGRKILSHCDTWKPDAVLLIDYGVFHLHMAKELKKRYKERCPKIYYYIPPQVWASRKGRIQKIKRSVDHVFCIFPFEKALYEAHGIPVTYVGHPLASQMEIAGNNTDNAAFYEKHQLDAKKPIVGIFPGSRKMEIDYLLKPMFASLPQIVAKYPDVQFVLAKAVHLDWDYFDKKLIDAKNQVPGLPDVLVIENENQDIMKASQALMLASGTVTLEAALTGTPMLLVYKGHPLAYQIVMKVLLLPYIGLPNILHCIPDVNHPDSNVLPPIVPELLQDNVNPVAITNAILPLLESNSQEYQNAKLAFTEIQQKLQPNGKPAAQHIADILLGGGSS